MVEFKEVARFECRVKANPFTETTVKWSLPDHPGGRAGWVNKEEVIVDEEEGVSTLLLHFAGRAEAGRVVCTADNGVGEEEGGAMVRRERALIVQRG